MSRFFLILFCFVFENDAPDDISSRLSHNNNQRNRRKEKEEKKTNES